MKLKITLVVDYDPTIGEGSYGNCETLVDCLELDQTTFDLDVAGYIQDLATAGVELDDASLELLGDDGHVVR